MGVPSGNAALTRTKPSAKAAQRPRRRPHTDRFGQTVPNAFRAPLQLQLEDNLRNNFIPGKEYKALKAAFGVWGRGRR